MQLSKSHLFKYSSLKSRSGLMGDLTMRAFGASNEYDLAVIGGGPGGMILNSNSLLHRLCGCDKGCSEGT
jgi:hypothetical protein